MRKRQTPDLTETKAHIFIAGHELLKAAEGMLKFCKNYVENTSECHKHPYMLNLLNKGIHLAKDLGTSMTKESFIREATTKIITGFCDTLEDEMRQEKATKRPAKPRRTRPARPKKQARTKKKASKKVKRKAA